VADPGNRPGFIAIALSVVVHAGGLGAIVASGLMARPAPVEFRVYEVDMVAGDELLPPEVQQIASSVEEPPQEPEPEPEPEEPEQTVPSPAPQREAPRPQTRPDPNAQREEVQREGVGSGDLTIQIEGLQARYPEYYENIIRTLYRFFRWNEASRPNVEYFFYINRDGSVSDIRLIRTSGNVAFNLEAMGAIEAAGERKAFGALPGDFQGDRLPVLFSFQPR
jgi:outer membrane biosynthesis protein TonB